MSFMTNVHMHHGVRYGNSDFHGLHHLSWVRIPTHTHRQIQQKKWIIFRSMFISIPKILGANRAPCIHVHTHVLDFSTLHHSKHRSFFTVWIKKKMNKKKMNCVLSIWFIRWVFPLSIRENYLFQHNRLYQQINCNKSQCWNK